MHRTHFKTPSAAINGIFSAVVCFLLSILSGCGVDDTWPDLEKAILSYIKPQVKTTDTYKPPLAVTFTADAYRSPFEPLSQSAASDHENPLLAWSLSSLRFTGTVVASNSIIGFIMTPNNRVYQVKEGDRIGNRKGRIILIDSGKIIVREGQESQGHPAAENTVTLRLKGAD